MIDTQLSKYIPGRVPHDLPAPSPAQREVIQRQLAENPFAVVRCPGTSAHGHRNATAIATAIKRNPELARKQCEEAGLNPADWFPSDDTRQWTNRLGR